MISVLFSAKCSLFHNVIFFFFCSNNTFLVNYALKFTYQPGCLKVNFWCCLYFRFFLAWDFMPCFFKYFLNSLCVVLVVLLPLSYLVPVMMCSYGIVCRVALK